jgi:hypothetical protein
MAESRADYILRVAERLTADAAYYQDQWQQITDYMQPGRRNLTFLTGQTTPGQRMTDKLYDGTAITASNLLAASIHGSVTAPDSYWCYLRAQHDEINNDHDCGLWLDDATRRLHWHYQQSNLYAELGELYLDNIVYGTGDIHVVEKDEAARQFSGFRFKTVPLGEYVIAENADGMIDTVCRPRMAWSARGIAETFPETVPAAVTRALAVDPFQPFEVVHFVGPREYGKVEGFSKGMPFATVYVETSTRTILSESGHQENPHICSRWWTVGGEAWGRGPGIFALPDVKSLNLAKELELTAWALDIRPPLKRRSHGIVGMLSITPGYVNVMDNLDDVKPLLEKQAKADWTATQMKAETVARAIREQFFHDQLQLVENDRMTATEVEQRVAIMQRFLGPTMSRMHSELLQPLIQRTFLMLYRRRALLPPPPKMQDYVMRGGALQIRYEGPLARAQRLSELNAVNRAIGSLGQLAQVHPRFAAAFDNLDPDGIADIILDASGVPTRARRDPRVRDQMRQQAAQAIEQQRQIEAGTQIAQGIGAVAPMVKAMQAPAGTPA